MALTYGFYNSIEGDRVYDAIQFGRIFDGIIKDGVYATYEKGMMVIASSNPAEVIIQPGRAWFNHTWSYNDANVIFEAPAPEVLLERYDALVLEINEELSSRENSYKWVTGTPSSRPERPTLTNTSTIHQYPLCYVHRYPETTMIYTRDITNMIGTSECPFATGVLEGIDLDAWINQWDDEFHTWENSKKTQFEAWMLSQETAFTTWYNAFKDQMASDVQEVEDFVDYLKSVLDASTAVHLQEEIDELKNEISSGSHITVTTINSELYGRNVTITEAGGTVFTEKFDNTGVAVFKSVPYVGNLTISSTYGTQTAERVVNTPYYARYEFAIAFWAATVNIIGDPEMSGSSVTVKDSNETVVGSVVLDSEGTGVYTAIKPDTYKFSITYGGETMEVTLSVTQETTYTVDLHAASFKWQDWLEAGGVTGPYSSLDDVLEDEVALRRLFTVHASVDYMASIDKANEDVEKIINNDLSAKWINLRDYALDTLYANTIIKGYMDTADKYGYGEWCLMPQVPTMTSNTAPYGTVNASGYESGAEPYKAFDGNTSTYWQVNTTSHAGKWIEYVFPNPVRINRATFYVTSTFTECTWRIDASNDGTNYTPLYEGSFTSGDVSFDNDTAYLRYRLYCVSGTATYSLSVRTLQFYAWQPKGNVPVMTSATAPYGSAMTNSQSQSGYEYWKAFDGNPSTQGTVTNAATVYIGYKFVNPVCVKKISYYNLSISNGEMKFQASNTGNNDDWIDLATLTDVTADVKINNSTYYLYYRIYQNTKTGSSTYSWLNELQMYGRELSVSVPKMDTNTTPYGEAIESSEWSGSYSAYKAFASTSVSGNGWGASSGDSFGNAYVGYDFLKGMRLRKVLAGFEKGTSNLTSVQFRIEGTNDKNGTWTPIDTITMNTFNAWLSFDMDSDVSYRYIRGVYLNNSASALSYGNGAHFQFYGLDYSEKEFEEGTTKKWLYDHGVELETMIEFHSDNSAYTTKGENTITTKVDAVATRSASILCGVDLSDYSRLRTKIESVYSSYGNDANGPTLVVISTASPASTVDNDAITQVNTPVQAPYNISLDVSSFNTSKYVGIRSRNVSSNQFIKIMSVNELWLE